MADARGSALSEGTINERRIRDGRREMHSAPLRVAMVADPFIAVPPKGYGGTERVVATLAEGLCRRQHRVCVFTTQDSTVRAPIETLFEKAAWPGEPYRQVAHLAWAMQKIREAGVFNVVHVHSPLACAMASTLSLPLVFTSHWPEPSGFGQLLETVRSSCSRFQLVGVSERHCAILGLNHEPRRVYHGVDESEFAIGCGERNYAAFLGRFMKEKGVHIAIDVAVQSGVPIRLAGVAIHESDRRYYSREVKGRLRLHDVTWVGEVDGRTKCDFLAGALALLVPARIEEAFGLALVEAMMCGTPVIAFRKGAIPEIVEDGVTGWVVDTREEMVGRLRELQRGRNFDHGRCRERAIERFSARRMVDEYLDLYIGLAGRQTEC